MDADADRLDAALEAGPAALGLLPRRLLELAAVAVELAEALATSTLSAEERERIRARAVSVATRRRRLEPLRLAGRWPVLVGGAAAAVTVVGLAALRRGHLPGVSPA